MSEAHTPGKLNLSDTGGWSATHDGIGNTCYQGIKDVDGKVVALAVAHDDSSPFSNPETRPNARRLVACWNACQGVSTENLEDNMPVKELAKRYNAALHQRDELLTELKKARAYIAEHHASFVETVTNQHTKLIDDAEDLMAAESGQDLLDGIDEVIAKAEGQ